MDADFSIELGRDDPVLEFPWTDPAGKVSYFDLKRKPELTAHVEEAARFPELASFLKTVNSHSSLVESAKCDVWLTTELTAEEEIFGAQHKIASYVDLLFSEPDRQLSFAFHEHLVKRLIELLRHAPEMRSAAEGSVRRCYFRREKETQEGFYVTLYVNGYGDDEAEARLNWGIALKLAGNALLQLSVAGI